MHVLLAVHVICSMALAFTDIGILCYNFTYLFHMVVDYTDTTCDKQQTQPIQSHTQIQQAMTFTQYPYAKLSYITSVYAFFMLKQNVMS